MHPAQVKQLVGDFGFAVVEEPPPAVCGGAEALRFSVIAKDYDLFARPWQPCVSS
jgi:hypothetical protein